jgi:hypothetical protein
MNIYILNLPVFMPAGERGEGGLPNEKGIESESQTGY